jgi:hypothetical protein
METTNNLPRTIKRYKVTKWIFMVVALLAYTFLVIQLTEAQTKTDLEIYTQDDIYYIDGLTVTRENSNDGYIFITQQDLKLFISDLTYNDIK